MCLVSHSQAVGGSQHHRVARDQRRPGVRSCAAPGVCTFPRTVRADSAAEASYVLAVACRSNPFLGRGHGSEGGDMTSKRIRTIAGWMLAPLLVAGAVTAAEGAG